MENNDNSLPAVGERSTITSKSEIVQIILDSECSKRMVFTEEILDPCSKRENNLINVFTMIGERVQANVYAMIFLYMKTEETLILDPVCVPKDLQVNLISKHSLLLNQVGEKGQKQYL